MYSSQFFATSLAPGPYPWYLCEVRPTIQNDRGTQPDDVVATDRNGTVPTLGTMEVSKCLTLHRGSVSAPRDMSS